MNVAGPSRGVSYREYDSEGSQDSHASDENWLPDKVTKKKKSTKKRKKEEKKQQKKTKKVLKKPTNSYEDSSEDISSEEGSGESSGSHEEWTPKGSKIKKYKQKKTKQESAEEEEEMEAPEEDEGEWVDDGEGDAEGEEDDEGENEEQDVGKKECREQKQEQDEDEDGDGDEEGEEEEASTARDMKFQSEMFVALKSDLITRTNPSLIWRISGKFLEEYSPIMYQDELLYKNTAKFHRFKISEQDQYSVVSVSTYQHNLKDMQCKNILVQYRRNTGDEVVDNNGDND